MSDDALSAVSHASAAPLREDVDRIVEAIIFLCSEARRVTKEAAREHGLTGPQITAVKLLAGLGDLSLSDLGARMSATNSTITGLVDRLEKAGLVRRERSHADRRVVRLRLTEAGAELAREVPVPSMELFERALRALGEDERGTLRALLRRLSDLVRADVAARERTSSNGSTDDRSTNDRSTNDRSTNDQSTNDNR